ncbi:MAG: glycoside hydrolase family 38 [Verrucomicrobia bacterium]|nr:glycoside hydrolase family 38 [Verrucomicrobiota bacterium]
MEAAIMSKYTFHLICNAHLDPVWLWDWREGLTEGLITCRTVLDLMDKDPDLTFSRGEAVIYEFIEKTDPATFRRIRRRIEEGRWDFVGGTYLQSDTNMPSTATFMRLYDRGQGYFADRFGRPATVAWFADSFGHSAGLPEIMAASGIKAFAFSRPEMRIFPIARPAFWWQAPSGARILCYRPRVGFYCTERWDFPGKLDGLLTAAEEHGLHNVGVLYGMGNHGGGPTLKFLREFRRWTERHPEVRLVHSGFHRFFDALAAEASSKAASFLPSVRGELNFVLRGCYSSVSKFKYAFRRSEALVQRADKTGSLIKAAINGPAPELDRAWDSILFNTFHDVLPGSSIERAYDDQLAWLGVATHDAQRAELAALYALGLAVDTSVAVPEDNIPSGVAPLIWNPHPYAFEGYVEFEAMLDYRPIWKYSNKPREVPIRLLGPDRKPLSFQDIATEQSGMPHLAWRKRLAVPVKLPPLGWSVLEMAYLEGTPAPRAPANPASVPRPGAIGNSHYSVEASVGAKGVKIFHNGRSVFGDKVLSAAIFDDPWGSWGAMNEDRESLAVKKLRENWKVRGVEILEKGPHKASLWVRLAGARSRMDLVFSLYAGRDAVDVQARVLWDERSARLKLIMPAGDQAEFDVPGAAVTRKPCGEVPGGRWVRVEGKRGTFGFASDALYNFECSDGELRATVCRASRYASDVTLPHDKEVWRPAVDSGELRFNFVITPGGAGLPRMAEQLEQPPVILVVPAHKGRLGRAGSFASLAPAQMRLLALSGNDRGLLVRVQNTGRKAAIPRLRLLDRDLSLGSLRSNEIGSWLLSRTSRGWRVRRTMPGQ